MKYKIIQSGSDGNCTIVEEAVAVDIGVPWYKIAPHARDLTLVLCTHQHGDHFNRRTVRTLARTRPLLRWACGEWMVEHLLAAGVDKRNIDVFEMGKWYKYQIGDRLIGAKEILVSPFETHHDVRNCGWKIFKDYGNSIFYATDLGTLQGIEGRGFKTYLLEANYTEADLQRRLEEKLETGEFAHETRVAENHLSWEEASAWLGEQMAPDSIWIPMHQHKEREVKQDAVQNAQGYAPNLPEREQPDGLPVSGMDSPDHLCG